MADSDPLISIVLIIGDWRQRSRRALQSILAQDGLEQAEVILMDTSTTSAPPLPESVHPAVRLVRTQPSQSLGQIRAEAVRLARGVYVSSLEEHCVALPGWLNGMISRAQEGSWAGIGGEIHNLNPQVGMSEVFFIMHYPPGWRAPARFGVSNGIPGHNSAYKREALLQCGEELVDLLQTEALLWWKLQEKGGILGIDPAIKFKHRNEVKLAEIGPCYFHMHRMFGGERARTYQWPLWLRLLRILSLPLVPVVRLYRYIKMALNERPSELTTILRYAPIMLIAQSFTALGLGAGYIFGAGTSVQAMTNYELNVARGQVTDQ
jgi:Glycosyl transferase family 2